MLRRLRLILLLLFPLQTLHAADWNADPPAKPSDWKPLLEGPIPLGQSPGRVTFADHFGHFALVTERGGKADRIAYDLRTGKVAARLPETAKSTSGAGAEEYISPDGKYAVRSTEFISKSLELTALTGGEVRKVELPAAVYSYAWIDSKRIFVTLAIGFGEWAIIDADKATVGKRITLQGRAFTNPGLRGFAISPGGRTVAVPTSLGVELIDTESLEVRLVFAEALATWKLENKLTGTPTVAFSADGRQIALLTGATGADGTLRIWTAGEKSPTTCAVIRGGAAGYPDSRALQPVRGGGWLIDNENLLNAAGESLRTVPFDTFSMTTRLALDADTIVGFGASPPDLKSELRILRGSGPKILPLLTGNYRNAEKKVPATDTFVGSFPPASPTARLPVARSAPTETPFSALHVARTGQWAVIERDFSRNPENSPKRSVSIWDASGVGPVIDLPAGRRVFGELAGANGFLTTDAKMGSSQTTIAFHNPKGEMLCRWRPNESPQRESEILYGAVIDTTRAVTLNRAGLLVSWKLPTCEAEWTLEFPGAWKATLDPSGDRIVVGTPKGLQVVSAKSGESLGILEADFGSAPPQGTLCIRGDGTQIVAIRLLEIGIRMFVWNLSGDRTPKSFAPPPGTNDRTLIHLGGELIFDGLRVIDVRRKQAVWQSTDFLSNLAASQPSDGRIWHLSAPQVGNFFNTALAVPYPRLGIEGILDEAERSNERLMSPGDRVRFQFDFPGAPERYRQDAMKAATARLKSGQITIADDAAATLTIRAEIVPTGDTLNLVWQDGKKFGQRETLRPYNVHCTAELRNGGRVVLPGRPYDIKMDLGRSNLTITITDDSDSAKEFFERQVWKQVVMWATNAVPGPTAISASGEPIVFPLQGRLKNETIETDWPKGYSPPPEPTGELPADSKPIGSETPAAAQPKWIWFAGCATGLVVVTILAVGLVLWMRKRKPVPKLARPIRKSPPRKRRVDDDE